MKKFLSILMLIVFSSPAGVYDHSYVLLSNMLQLGGETYAELQKRDLEIVKIDIDLVGKDRPKQVLKTLSNQFKYVFVCIGAPDRIKDIDIKIYFMTSEGTLVLIVKDEDVDPTAEVRIENPTPGTYLIQIEAYEMQPGHEGSMGYYYLTVAHT